MLMNDTNLVYLVFVFRITPKDLSFKVYFVVAFFRGCKSTNFYGICQMFVTAYTNLVVFERYY